MPAAPDAAPYRRQPSPPPEAGGDVPAAEPGERPAAEAAPDGVRLRDRIGRAVRAAHSASVPF
ncbi:hypothetical protein [Pseudonocardia humida]|uniref:Uncharacterized protein n=1 Tax=Pseudonocardia humida TaxID=2800819 RepID=A0ABT1A6L3_9PSEU|nr:hypothetical protein [Pseudonocardia humida]MCO1658657.1 hypothetical protein [Pseudonocardia humida]